MTIRKPLAGLRHVALFVRDLEACERFYCELLGMQVEWRPDPDNLYLCGGIDNLALHRSDRDAGNAAQKLDHIGFIVDSAEQVDAWHEFLLGEGVEIRTAPKTHRDGARSFYCLDPDATLVQIIHHPPIAKLP